MAYVPDLPRTGARRRWLVAALDEFDVRPFSGADARALGSRDDVACWHANVGNVLSVLRRRGLVTVEGANGTPKVYTLLPAAVRAAMASGDGQAGTAPAPPVAHPLNLQPDEVAVLAVVYAAKGRTLSVETIMDRSAYLGTRLSRLRAERAVASLASAERCAALITREPEPALYPMPDGRVWLTPCWARRHGVRLG